LAPTAGTKNNDFNGTISSQIRLCRERTFGSGYLLKLQPETAKREENNKRKQKEQIKTDSK
jgi:hypothetical protein